MGPSDRVRLGQTALEVTRLGLGLAPIGGLYVPVGRQKDWKLHAGARYFYGGEATYLREGDIEDNPDGSITLFPRTSKTHQVTWQLGVAYTFPRGRR